MEKSEVVFSKGLLFNQRFNPSKDIERIYSNGVSPDCYIDNYGGLVNPFIIDQGKILESKSLRRESDKTQVFFSPDNPHIRTRSIHTNEVVSIAIKIADILGLNVELCQSIALGHDLGHGPSGHLFERVSKAEGIEFHHEIFSAIIAVFIERNGGGLNLTRQTLEGILSHSDAETKKIKLIDEYKIVMYSDKIAYTFSDFNDVKRFNKNLISEKDINTINSLFPDNQRYRVVTCINALIEESIKKGFVSFEDSIDAKNFKEVRSIMKRNYPTFDSPDQTENIRNAFDSISSIKGLDQYDPILLTALMTDKELLKISNRTNLDSLKDFGIYEIIDKGFLEGRSYNSLVSDLKSKLMF